MPDHPEWQGASPATPDLQSPGGASQLLGQSPAGPRRISADSFKSLMERLKKPAAIHTSVIVPELPTPAVPEPQVIVAPPPVINEPAEPPEFKVEQVPEPLAPEPEPMEAEPEPDKPDPWALPPEFAAAVAPAPAIQLPPILPAPTVPEVKIAEEEPDHPESASLSDTAVPAHAPRKPLVDPQLEFVMRLIASAPSNDERIKFLDEAAALAATERMTTAPVGDLAELEEKYLQSLQSEQSEVATSPWPVPEDEPAPTADAAMAESSAAPAQADAWRVPEPEIAQDLETVAEPPPEPLTHLASLNESEAAELARSLLDMMASGVGTGLPHERALAADTLLRILPRLPMKPLVLLADRLALMDNPPPLLIAKLIRDKRIDLAGPLLENASHVTDQDLVAVIEECDGPRCRLIARRRKVSREISDQLIGTNDAAVLLTLVRNANAEISHEGFIKLSQAAAGNAELLAPLCTRADLPVPQAFELFWSAPVQLRRYLLSRFLTDSETLTKILKITMATQGGDELADAGFPPASDVQYAMSHAVMGNIDKAAEVFAGLMSVDQGTVSRIFNDPQGEPIAILLKAAGCSRADFTAHYEQLAANSFVPAGKASELQALFETLSFNKARILLTYWDWAVKKSGPYAPLH